MLLSHAQREDRQVKASQPQDNFGGCLSGFSNGLSYGSGKYGLKTYDKQYPTPFNRPSTVPSVSFPNKPSRNKSYSLTNENKVGKFRANRPSTTVVSAPSTSRVYTLDKNNITIRGRRPAARNAVQFEPHDWQKHEEQVKVDLANQKQKYTNNFKVTDIRLGRREQFPKPDPPTIGAKDTIAGQYGKTLHINNVAPPRVSLGHPTTAAKNHNFGGETMEARRIRTTKLQDKHYASIYRKVNPLYHPANHTYGNRAPAEIENQELYYGHSEEFSASFPHPMWRDNSLVTSVARPFLVGTF